MNPLRDVLTPEERAMYSHENRIERLTKIMRYVAAHTTDAWAMAYLCQRLSDMGYDASLSTPPDVPDAESKGQNA